MILMDRNDWSKNIKNNCPCAKIIAKETLLKCDRSKVMRRNVLCNGGKHPLYCDFSTCPKLK